MAEDSGETSYRGLKMLEEHGDNKYKKDVVYCLSATFAPLFFAGFLASILSFLPPTVQLIIVALGAAAGAALGAWLYTKPVDELPDMITYPSVEVDDEMLDNGGVAVFHTEEEKYNQRYLVRMINDGEGYQYIVEVGRWRNPLVDVDPIPEGEMLIPGRMSERYGHPGSGITIDLERLDPRLEIDGNEWTLK